MTKENLMIKLEDWKSELIRKEKSQKTIGEYYRDVLQFIESLPKDKDVTEKTITDNKEENTVVTQYKQDLKNKEGKKENTNLSISSINRKIISINAFLTFCGLQSLKVKQVKEQGKKDNFSDDDGLTLNEFKKIQERANIEGNETVFYIMETLFNTGMRYNELRFITVEALKNKEAIVENKGKIRTIPLNPSLCKILLEWAKTRNITNGMIFITKHGTFIKNEQFSRAFKKIAGKLRYIKKDKVHPHSVRHLFARCILENDFKIIDKDGKPKEKNLDSKLVDLADILGHSRLETTRIYLRTSTSEKSKMINSMINNTIENKAFDSSKVKTKKRRKNK